MTTGGYILMSGIGGAVSGAIGASVANASRSYPVLKGSLVVAALNSALAGAMVVGARGREQLGTSGPLGVPANPSGCPECPSLHNPLHMRSHVRFP